MSLDNLLATVTCVSGMDPGLLAARSERISNLSSTVPINSGARSKLYK